MTHIPLKVTGKTQPDFELCAQFMPLYIDGARLMPSCVVTPSKLNLAIWNLFKEEVVAIKHEGVDHWEACVQVSSAIRTQFGKYRQLKSGEKLHERMQNTA